MDAHVRRSQERCGTKRTRGAGSCGFESHAAVKRNYMKNSLFCCILVLLLYVFVECSALAGLAFLARFADRQYMPADRLSAGQITTIKSFIEGRADYFQFDTETGWTIRKNGRYKNLYRANASGFRADREYSMDVPEGHLRICTFGDSFTHCDEVGNDFTWQQCMESDRAELEVLNFGVGAYGLDQAYLRYENTKRRYATDYVFIGFMPENIYRMVNTFRAFYQAGTGLPLAKPRYILQDGRIALLKNPLPSLSDYQTLLEDTQHKSREIGVHDYFYHRRYVSGPFDWSPGVRLLKMAITEVADRFSGNRPVKKGFFNESSEAYKITLKVFDLFYRACRQHATPVILVFPHIGNMQQAQRNGGKEYAPLLAYFDYMGYRYIDLLDAFAEDLREDTVQSLFVGQHYSAKANRLVAAHLLRYLDGRMQLSRMASD